MMKMSISGRLSPALLALALCTQTHRAASEPVRLPAGTPIALTLQHNVTSAYVPAGEPIYFRVSEDVQVDGKTLIAAGTLAQGKMIDASNRGMVGKSGSMSLGVKTVTAVDGTAVLIDADLAKQGRSRGLATLGWTIFWGIPGLITKGVNPYLERDTVIDATVLIDVSIDPGLAPAEVVDDASSGPPKRSFTILGHRFTVSADKPFRFDIERSRKLKDVVFKAKLPEDESDPQPMLRSVRLVAVDGVPIAVPIEATSTTADSFTLPGWAVLQFARDGSTRFDFEATDSAGRVLVDEYSLDVRIVRKPPKKKKNEAASANQATT